LVGGAGGSHVVDHGAEVLVVGAADRTCRLFAGAVAVGVDVEENPYVPAERGEVAPLFVGGGPDDLDGRGVAAGRIEVREPSIAQRRGPAHRGLGPAGDDNGWAT